MNIVRGRISGPGLVAIDGAGELPFNSGSFPAALDREVDVGIRPEELSVGDQNSPSGLSFSREFVEELGATRLVHGNAGAALITFALPSSADLPSQLLRLTAAPAAVHLFDVGSGASLAQPGKTGAGPK
jgi:sn-glycerol 3-phosphate transport system ATP-binding protein